ncbi:MAG: hypothetical protein O3A51_13085 [Verrucomicrobia bacterium]|nr:hypothetical protein [Verrucomicrobiota bacterium]
MAKTNYSFEKRQRDLAKQRKKAEKRQRKQGAPSEPAGDASAAPPSDNPPSQP